MAESILSDVLFTLARQSSWQVMLMELNQFDFKHLVSEGQILHSLIMHCKQCLTVIRLGREITPSVEPVEHCYAFMCNMYEWPYLSYLSNTADGFIEVSRLLACLVRDVEQKNVRKQVRDLWNAVLTIYQPGN